LLEIRYTFLGSIRLFQFDSILSGFVGLSSRSVLVLSKYFPLSDLD